MPKSLQQESDGGGRVEIEDDSMDDAENPVVVVCSGDFVEQVRTQLLFPGRKADLYLGCASLQFI